MKYIFGSLILLLLISLGYVFIPLNKPEIDEKLNVFRQNLDFQPVITPEMNKESSPPLSPISVNFLRARNIESDKYQIEEVLSNGNNYQRYIVSYKSEGEKVLALLTVPLEPMPDKGYPAIIFNHGYIPPRNYSTLNNYISYVDYLASSGFVVLKIDMRGHGNSEGLATGSYFSSTYTIDVISALKSLQKSDIIDPKRIGIWGHSMSGNLVLRSMLVNEDIKAGVIWAGAVYSYEDFGKYRISDSSYMARPQMQIVSHPNRDNSPEITKLREDYKSVDFSNNYWKEVSLTQNINYLKNPLQIHHSINDSVVNVGYSRDLSKILDDNKKVYEYYEYEGGGHNITGIYFNKAMQRTVEFFKKKL